VTVAAAVAVAPVVSVMMTIMPVMTTPSEPVAIAMDEGRSEGGVAVMDVAGSGAGEFVDDVVEVGGIGS